MSSAPVRMAERLRLVENLTTNLPSPELTQDQVTELEAYLNGEGSFIGGSGLFSDGSVGGGSPENAYIFNIDQLAKQRIVRRALGFMSPADRASLIWHHTKVRQVVLRNPVFLQLRYPGIAVNTADDVDALIRLCTNVQTGAAEGDDRVRLKKIDAECRVRYEVACVRYKVGFARAKGERFHHHSKKTSRQPSALHTCRVSAQYPCECSVTP